MIPLSIHIHTHIHIKIENILAFLFIEYKKKNTKSDFDNSFFLKDEKVVSVVVVVVVHFLIPKPIML
jgi:hypothetical protein